MERPFRLVALMYQPVTTSHLSVEGLTKRFGRVTAVDNLSLDLHQGEFVCLVGPSGCGKTTALRVIAGLERPTAGRILSNGGDITLLPPAERGMGMVFQSYALFPNMSAAQNIAFAFERRTKDVRSRVAELLALVDLASMGGKRPHELSGGQQQRIAIARALARAPRFLLLDEPLSALDPQIRARLRNELKSLQRRLGITTLMVTHDQAEALAIADRIAVMRAGRLLQIGSPREIYTAPADPFTGEFVGAMNLLPAVAGGPESVQVLGKMPLAVRHQFSPGVRVLAAIRPEFVVLSAAPATDLLPATIVDREFQGAFVRLSLSIESFDRPLLADVGNADALAASGAQVSVRLPPEHVRLFEVAR
ncbi:MAG TPA: ATP-binding cassette domain-containing protein [Rhizomicrobium sp.]|nr:ATP-binding cassette domain-containing protein [Rhizomicrobium sp.]